jgi:hypothetical protein
MYFNPHHGFVDPITGILIWIGVIALLMKPKRSEADDLMLSSFFILWMVFTFIVTMAPDYHRLLVILPSVAYLVTVALSFMTSRLSQWLRRRSYKTPLGFNNAVVAICTMTIVFWNLGMYLGYAKRGSVAGDAYGGTGRYVEARKHIAGYTFYIVADTKEYPYFLWWKEETWIYWITFFTDGHQLVQALAPDGYLSIVRHPPFSIFMNKKLWEKTESGMRKMFPGLTTQSIQTGPSGDLLAVEVL